MKVKSIVFSLKIRYCYFAIIDGEINQVNFKESLLVLGTFKDLYFNALKPKNSKLGANY